MTSCKTNFNTDPNRYSGFVSNKMFYVGPNGW